MSVEGINMSELRALLNSKTKKLSRWEAVWQWLQNIELSSRLHFPGLDIYFFFTLFQWQLRYLSGYGGFAIIAGPFGFTFKSKAAELRNFKRAQEDAKKLYQKEIEQKVQAQQNQQAESAGQGAAYKNGGGHTIN